MPIYEYQTIPQSDNEPVQRFEVRQSMSEDALTIHPETGQPIKKVFSSFGVSSATTFSAPDTCCMEGGSNPGSCCGGGPCMH